MLFNEIYPLQEELAKLRKSVVIQRQETAETFMQLVSHFWVETNPDNLDVMDTVTHELSEMYAWFQGAIAHSEDPEDVYITWYLRVKRLLNSHDLDGLLQIGVPPDPETA